MSNRKLITVWGPVVGWMALIFYLSSRSTLPTFPGIVPDVAVKKSGHLVEYAILAGLVWRALRHTSQVRNRAVFAFILTVVYAASDEFHQSFVPGRTSRVTDVLIDSAGTLLCLIALEWWHNKRSGAGSAQQPTPDQATRPIGGRDPEAADRA